MSEPVPTSADAAHPVSTAVEGPVTADDGRRQRALRVIGSGVSSCAGAGGAALVMATQGSAWVAVTIFVMMQIWLVSELVVRQRNARLHEFLVRKAAEDPRNHDLRTLLVDNASTCPTEAGERLPLREVLGNGRSARSRHHDAEDNAPRAD